MSKQNLYELPLDGAVFELQCGGNLGSENESCVDLAAIPGAEEGFVLRDSKTEGAGREVRYEGAELDAFAVNWVRSRGLTV
ncbi:DUF397 domain-containing protein [Streptomyces sp. NRRL B-24484]|uniref:DUF397 domain-containing protein n=1 Tax=Streptomyces sp. NRRL B-24484 TaxID=1463833 RepID=UPI0004C0814F|nr:DUF397 domain-containing protein [Streptomyces sp. NRRL B-24484]